MSDQNAESGGWIECSCRPDDDSRTCPNEDLIQAIGDALREYHGYEEGDDEHLGEAGAVAAIFQPFGKAGLLTNQGWQQAYLVKPREERS